MEHRWGLRVEVDIEAELLTTRGVALQGRIINASLSGAFVESATKLPLLSRVSVRPLHRDDEWLEACVVRVEESGVALEWLDPHVQNLDVIRYDPRS